MTAVASEPVTEEFDDEFDLDIRIDDLDVIGADPDRTYLASTLPNSCTACCVTAGCHHTRILCPTLGEGCN